MITRRFSNWKSQALSFGPFLEYGSILFATRAVLIMNISKIRYFPPLMCNSKCLLIIAVYINVSDYSRYSKFLAVASLRSLLYWRCTEITNLYALQKKRTKYLYCKLCFNSTGSTCFSSSLFYEIFSVKKHTHCNDESRIWVSSNFLYIQHQHIYDFWWPLRHRYLRLSVLVILSLFSWMTYVFLPRVFDSCSQYPRGLRMTIVMNERTSIYNDDFVIFVLNWVP